MYRARSSKFSPYCTCLAKRLWQRAARIMHGDGTVPHAAAASSSSLPPSDSLLHFKREGGSRNRNLASKGLRTDQDIFPNAKNRLPHCRKSERKFGFAYVMGPRPRGGRRPMPRCVRLSSFGPLDPATVHCGTGRGAKGRQAPCHEEEKL